MLTRLNSALNKFVFQGIKNNIYNFNFKNFSLTQQNIRTFDLAGMGLPSLPKSNNIKDQTTENSDEIKAEFMNKRSKMARRKRAKRKYGKKISLRNR